MWNQSSWMVAGAPLHFRECRLAQRSHCPAPLNKLPVWKGSSLVLGKCKLSSSSSPSLALHPEDLLWDLNFHQVIRKINKKKRWKREGDSYLGTWCVIFFFLFLSFVFSFTAPDAICFPLFCPHYPVWIWFGGCVWQGEGHRESFVHLVLSDSLKKI